MAGERNDAPGYQTLGRLFALGYIKGLMEAVEKTNPMLQIAQDAGVS